MSSVDSVTALAGYQVQNTNLLSQIASLQNQITSLQNQNTTLSMQPQTQIVPNTYVFDNGDTYVTSTPPISGNGSRPYVVGTQASIQIGENNSQISTLQSQISPLQTQQTNLSQIISQLQSDITTYVNPSPISSSNPSTTSDTAHNIATGLTSFVSSIPKTDLYIGLGVIGLIFLLK